MPLEGERLEKRIYGQEEYDHFLSSIGDLFTSKQTKESRSLDNQQKKATLELTQRQQVIANAKAQNEVFQAKKSQMEALAAQKLAEKADVQLSNAKTQKTTNYLFMGVVGLMVAGLLYGGIYIKRQNVKSARLRLQLQKGKLPQTA